MSFSECSRCCKAAFMSTRTFTGIALTCVPFSYVIPIPVFSSALGILRGAADSYGDPREIPRRCLLDLAGPCSGVASPAAKKADV